MPDDDGEQEAAVKSSDAEDGFEAEPDEAPELDAVVDEPPLLSDDDVDEPDSTTPTPGEGLGVDFAADDDLEDAEDDEVPFIEDDDDAFPEDEIDGLPGEGGAEDR